MASSIGRGRVGARAARSMMLWQIQAATLTSGSEYVRRLRSGRTDITPDARSISTDATCEPPAVSKVPTTRKRLFT